LIESTTDSEDDSRWTSLLPIVTERVYLGGLDPEASIEHAYANFVHQDLAGRPIERWRDEELTNFVRRYNVGWVACRSPAAVARFNLMLSKYGIETVRSDGRFKKAREIWQTVVFLTGLSTATKKDYVAQAHEAFALAAVLRKKYDVAIAEFKEAVDGAATPDPATMVRLGQAYNQAHKYDDAIAILDKVMAGADVHPQIKQFAQAERVRAIQAKGGPPKPAETKQ
jgi:tetratricopeptide (TPR) repeat protein